MEVDVVNKSYWTLNVESISVNEEARGSTNQIGILDSGTSLIVLDPETYSALGLPQSQTVPCNSLKSMPTISFKLGENVFELTPEQYVIKTTQYFVFHTCIMGITAGSVGGD